MNNLTPESTLRECFDYFEGSGSTQVVPVTIKQQDDDTQLAIFIKGQHETASVIMAELMTRIDELFEYSQQAEAEAEEHGDKSVIIAP